MKFIIFNQIPLYIAVENENIEIIKLLLENDQIDVNIISVFETISTRINFHGGDSYSNPVVRDRSKVTVLMKACQQSNIEIVKLLLSIKSLKINDYSTYLNIHGNDDDEDDDYDTEMYDESYYRKEISKTALVEAVGNEKLEIVKLLLSNDGIDISLPFTFCKENSQNSQNVTATPLKMALKIGNKDLIDLFHEK